MIDRNAVTGVLLACALSVAGCAGFSAEATPRVDLSGYSTFEFGGPVEAEPGAVLEQDDLLQRARTALAAELSSLGVARAPQPAADLLLAVRFVADQEIENRDPYFSVYPAEKYEVISLVLELTAARTGTRVWRGGARGRARGSARAVGVGELRFRPVEEERTIPVEDMVRHLTARLSHRRP
ncbi:MAG: DUF4136 domain-containing protein [Planctomycetota bacterium]